MGYSPWGCRQSETTEQLTHSMGQKELPQWLLGVPKLSPLFLSSQAGMRCNACI